MEIIVQRGYLGLNSPKIAGYGIIVIAPGIYSRTGKVMGNVDEARGVAVRAFPPRSEDQLERESVYTETLFAPERWDPTARNKLGLPGALCQQEPAQSEIDAAVARARAHLEEGRPPVQPMRRLVTPDPLRRVKPRLNLIVSQGAPR